MVCGQHRKLFSGATESARNMFLLSSYSLRSYRFFVTFVGQQCGYSFGVWRAFLTHFIVIQVSSGSLMFTLRCLTAMEECICIDLGCAGNKGECIPLVSSQRWARYFQWLLMAGLFVFQAVSLFTWGLESLPERFSVHFERCLLILLTLSICLHAQLGGEVHASVLVVWRFPPQAWRPAGSCGGCWAQWQIRIQFQIHAVKHVFSFVWGLGESVVVVYHPFRLCIALVDCANFLW